MRPKTHRTAAEPPAALTIGRLARAAGVGIETIRYYEQRGLLQRPAALRTAFREYAPATIDRIRFIKRAQDLGFTLAEITELLRLQDGAERRAVRRIAVARLQQIEHMLSDLGRMRRALAGLIEACEHEDHARDCPIIAALARCERPHAGPV